MKRSTLLSFWARTLILALFASLLTPTYARADAAPPQQPPGTNIVPGSETTQVRMLAETVTLTVLSRPSPRYPGQAKTEAVFMMRNLGAAEETMQVRFPLTFWDNQSDGFGNYPEIPDIQVQVDGKTIPTQRIQSDFIPPNGGIAHNRAPWAAFNISFPPGKNVIITVSYTTNGYGYEPFFMLRYILETGAGWNGTIGAADIILKLPYLAGPENVMLDGSGSGPQFVDDEARWHFTDFEPASTDNIQVSLLVTSTWQKVLDYMEYVRKYPDDGEGWGQLGKAYKEAIRFPKGYLRTDPAGQEMYRSGVAAYEKALTLLPDDALWHYGLADLLWAHYYYADARDMSELVRAVDELRKSLALDPKNQNAKDLAGWIGGEFPWAISQTDAGYDYLLLTTTPTIESGVFTPEPSTTPEPNFPTLTATATVEAIPPRPTQNPPGLPFCGGAALLLPALAGLLWLFSRRP